MKRLLTQPTPAISPQLQLAFWPAVVYAVGDVHGCLDELLEIERLIEADATSFAGAKFLVLLGDYVDRGPQSAQVIAHLLSAPPVGFTRITLAGNHEHMMLEGLKGIGVDHWLSLGGVETLRSYGLDDRQFTSVSSRRRRDMVLSHIPADHLEFLRSLPVSLQVESTVFVHAGIRRGVPMDQQAVDDLLWIREDFLEAAPGDGLTVVHGHSPVTRAEIRPGLISVDTGAYATGRLSAVRLSPKSPPRIFTTID